MHFMELLEIPTIRSSPVPSVSARPDSTENSQGHGCARVNQQKKHTAEQTVNARRSLSFAPFANERIANRIKQ